MVAQRVPEYLSLIVAIELFYFPQIGHPILDEAINVSLAGSGCLNNLLGEERSRRRRTSIICERAARRLELVPSLIKRCRQNMSCFRVKGCFPE